MGEDDIRNFLNSQVSGTKTPHRPVARRAQRTPRPQPQETYKKFSATHLFCAKCKQAMPVREKIILYLPDGDLYDYLCTQCGTSVGTRKAGRD